MVETTIRISADDHRRGRLDEEGRRRAIEALRSEGYVVLEGVLATDYVEELFSAYMSALGEKIARLGIAPMRGPDPRLEKNDGVLIDFRPEGGNHDLNRWNMHLPSCAPFLDDRLVANPFAMDIVDALLGKGCILPILASDTPLARAGFQAVHQDDVLPRLTINVPLVDVHDANAPIEVWPGSHRVRGGDDDFLAPVCLGADDIRQVLRDTPSRRILLPEGSMLLRDQRLLHRGTANRSPAARPMLSVLYFSRPPSVPPRALLDEVARLALSQRERARSGGRARRELLDRGNALGRHVEYLGGSDRDFRRVISADRWSGLSADARRVLRLASVEGNPQGDAGVPRSEEAAATLLAIVQRHAQIAAAHAPADEATNGADA
jgi:hypothetical protein